MTGRRRLLLPTMNPLRAYEIIAGFETQVPDIIEFVMSDRYADRGNLYPRQATLLKVVFLQDELFTDYDYAVIDEWTRAYEDSADERGEGNNGIIPDVLERIRINKEDGRKWFREVVLPIGRRGSKGHMGGLAGSYVLWNFLSKGDPQAHYGVDRDKVMACQVFAGKKEQAKAHQWKDLTNVITGAPCFEDYISRALDSTLSIFAPHDYLRLIERAERGYDASGDLASFLIEAREATVMAARGPASFMQYYDEMAHVVRAVAKSDAGEVYDSAVPALDQFGKDAFLWEPSSPWQKIGKFRENYEKVLEKDEDGRPTYPAMLMCQLTSWDPYKDWERTNDPALRLEARPERLLPPPPETPDRPPEVSRPIYFNGLRQAIQTFDADMEKLEQANPETFRVERRAHFAAVLDAYLNPEKIAAIWEPWPTEEDHLTQKRSGPLSIDYRAHGDPSKSGANFGWAVGHIAGVDDRELPHVVFDRIHAWIPGEFEGHEIDYEVIGNEIIEDMNGFMPTELSFDQWNSVSTIQKLRKHARKASYPKRVTIYERDATGPLNWATYETFKTALGLGLIHGPYFELASLELTFLQDVGHNKVDHPTSGPVQTKDVADCMAIVTYELIGKDIAAYVGKTLAEMPLGVSQPGGLPQKVGQSEEAHQQLSQFSRRRRAVQGANRARGRGY